jgi:hypothetical protein
MQASGFAVEQTSAKLCTSRCDDERGRCKALTSHSAAHNTFNICRHLTTESTHPIVREHAFDAWTVFVAATADPISFSYCGGTPSSM